MTAWMERINRASADAAGQQAMSIRDITSREGRRGSFGGLLRPAVHAALILEDGDHRDGGPPQELEVFLNPDSLRINGSSVWAKIAVPGLSHEVLQWSHTASRTVSFELVWSALEAVRKASTARYEARDVGAVSAQLWNYENFLASLIFPKARGRAPSRVSLAWPNLCLITGAVEAVEFTFARFAPNGAPIAFTCSIEMTELRTTFLGRDNTTDYFTTRTDVDLGFSLEEAEGVDFAFTLEEAYGSGSEF